jgi:hypothetical protein
MAERATAGNSSTSKSLMWMMIALFAGLAVLLGGGMLLAKRVLRSMGLAAAGSKDTVHTPIGSFRLEKEAQVGPGLPLYPRASLIVPGENDAANAVKEAQSGLEVSTYHTNDVREFVDSWYQSHLSPEYTRHDAEDRPLPEEFRIAHVPDDDIAFVAKREQMLRIVALSADSGGTKISLIKYNKPGPGGSTAPENTPMEPKPAEPAQPDANPPATTPPGQ